MHFIFLYWYCIADKRKSRKLTKGCSRRLSRVILDGFLKCVLEGFLDVIELSFCLLQNKVENKIKRVIKGLKGFARCTDQPDSVSWSVDGGVGDDLDELVHGGHRLEHRVLLDLHGDSGVLVDPVLDDLAVSLGLPHHLHELTVLLGQLEIDVDRVLGEVGLGVLVLAGEEAGGQDIPGGALPPVPEPDDVAGLHPAPAGEGVAGHDVGLGDDDAGLLLDQARDEVHVALKLGGVEGLVMLPQLLHEAGVLAAAWSRDHDIALHVPLTDLVTLLL